MALTQCRSGHFYDSSLYQACPYCQAQPDPSPALKAGTILSGRYAVRKLLGQGGFAMSYLAADKALGCDVVIKECFPSEIASRGPDGLKVCVAPENRDSFEFAGALLRDEARTLRSCRLEHVPAFHDFFGENDSVYLVLAYIPGLTLRDYMCRQGGRLAVSEARALLLPLLDTLDALHKQGILHRDIAPDNLLITEDGKSAFLIDFGAAPPADREAEFTLLKRGFAPAEQYMRAGRVGPWTDLYAFAATFYYVITGKVPPDAVERVCEDSLIPPSKLGVQLGAQAECALLRMLSVSTGDRCPAAEEFKRAMEAQSPPSAPAPGFASFQAESFGSTCALSSVPTLPGAPAPEPAHAPFHAEPFATSCMMPGAVQPNDTAPAPAESGKSKERAAGNGIGGLFSGFFSKRRVSAVPAERPAETPDCFGRTEAVGMPDAGWISVDPGVFPSEAPMTWTATMPPVDFPAPGAPMCATRPVEEIDFGHSAPAAIFDPAPAPLRIADVEFSALFPKRFLKGEYSVLEMYIYEEDKRRIIEEAIADAEGELKEKRGSSFQVRDESVVSIRLECADPAVQIEGNEESQVWHGRYLKFDFAVFLEERYPKRQLMFTATVLLNDVPATRLRFTAECNTMREQKMELMREDILSAFVSYASQDRSRVAAIIQGMKKARPDIDVFFDVDSLRSGEDWQRALRAEIERRDLLFLCWSVAARQSEWVDREWRYALENKGLSCIEPIPLDPPSICPPPKELSSKHFNDRGLLYMNR